MSNHYLLVDDARHVYFDCEKMYLGGGELPGQRTALQEQPFETWLRVVNWNDDPPEKTDRYRLARPEAQAVYDFLVASNWKVRVISLDDDDYDDIEEAAVRGTNKPGYKCLGTIWPWTRKP